MRAISVTSRLVIKAASQQNNTSIYNLINWLTRYMARNQDDWISTQGGWVCIVVFLYYIVFVYVYYILKYSTAVFLGLQRRSNSGRFYY